MISTMKKILIAFAIIVIPGMVLSAQLRSAHYEVIAPGGSADLYSAEMEQRFAAYNRVFCFDPALLPSPLRVRVFAARGDYDNYVTSKLGETRPGAVYLHYRDPANRELVILQGSEEEGRLVPHQAFIQFLRAFIPDPPVWIREGFAVYFSTLTFDRTRRTMSFEENLAWLETVKRLNVNPQTVLLAETALPNMQALSWSFVSFYMADRNSAYYRALTDSFTALSSAAAASENTQAVHRRLVLFNSIADLTRDYTAYISGKRTFTELVEEGQRAYTARNFTAAGEFFRRAIEQRSSHYAPYYYLGLIAYEDKKYSEAEEFYQTALNHGAERALIQYSRGVNAAAAGNRAEAIGFLQEAAASERYRDRANDLIQKLQ